MAMYRCSNCGSETKKWAAKCFQCNSFSTLEEFQPASAPAANAGLKNAGAVSPVKKAATLSEIGERPIHRTATGIGELDRVLGGGFVDGEVVLFAGEPGAGKSTLSMAIADKYAQLGHTVLYSSGEESREQIAMRAKRMGVTSENIRVINETSLETLLGHVDDEKPTLLVVDSLQTIASEAITGSIGSIAQSKEAAHTLTRLAKSRQIAMVLISQVVKSGEFAGAEAIQHIVDCSLFLESDSESPLKFLRAKKNRFGALDEVGVFTHSETGLEEVTDPGDIFLDTGEGDKVQGAAIGFMAEGIRQIPIEVQALAVTSSLANPRKQFNGILPQRGQIVCAILDKYCKTETYLNDVFVSTVAGVRVFDPLADLAIAAAMLSTLNSKDVSKKTAFVGELSLTGIVRGTYMMESKIREAQRLGFKRIVIPESSLKNIKGRYDIEVVTINNVKDLSKFLN